jgi:hypothetical protein
VTRSGGAVLGDPAVSGGCGSYSIMSWMACAAGVPAIRPESPSAMSMPADTPAAVTYLPSMTTRSLTGRAPNSRSRSRCSQCEVARRPSSSPAAARISDPVHTDVVQLLAASARRSQSSTGPLSICASWPGPPGTRTMSGCGTSPSAASAVTVSMPVSAGTGPAFSAAKTTRAPLSRLRIS